MKFVPGSKALVAPESEGTKRVTPGEGRSIDRLRLQSDASKRWNLWTGFPTPLVYPRQLLSCDPFCNGASPPLVAVLVSLDVQHEAARASLHPFTQWSLWN